jgi:mono/diheme cytochrome c family protein
MKPLRHLSLLFAVIALPAFAADVDNGRHLAQAHCAGCHNVGPNLRTEIVDSPPFEAIARKYDFNPELIAVHIIHPHPKMNLTMRRSEALDIAAYIISLAK